jgi:hypothetical protein
MRFGLGFGEMRLGLGGYTRPALATEITEQDLY